MKKPITFLLIGTLFLISCKNKKNESTEEASGSYFPVLSYIKSQVAHVDSSLYRIIKVVQKDSVARDTIYLKREEFKQAAKDFLSIPDISSGDLKDEYTESKNYDQDLELVALNYMPKEPGQEITRQEVMIKPSNEGDKVQSIFINRNIDAEDSTVQKILFWEVDKKFKWIKYTAPYKDPLFAVVEISTEGVIKITGRKSEYVGPSPWEIGFPAEKKPYYRPQITSRELSFTLKKK